MHMVKGRQPSARGLADQHHQRWPRASLGQSSKVSGSASCRAAKVGGLSQKPPPFVTRAVDSKLELRKEWRRLSPVAWGKQCENLFLKTETRAYETCGYSRAQGLCLAVRNRAPSSQPAGRNRALPLHIAVRNHEAIFFLLTGKPLKCQPRPMMVFIARGGGGAPGPGP